MIKPSSEENQSLGGISFPATLQKANNEMTPQNDTNSRPIMFFPYHSSSILIIHVKHFLRYRYLEKTNSVYMDQC